MARGAAIRAVQAHLASGEALADPRGGGTRRFGPALFPLYLIVHDASRRGQIVALLRQSGATPERLDSLGNQWNLWRE